MTRPSYGEPLDAVDLEILEALRVTLERADPPPPDLDDRVQFALTMQALRAEVAELERLPGELASADLDIELMLLIERSNELAGTRGTTTSFTLTFTADGLDLMVRGSSSGDDDTRRLDGWIVPPAPATIRATRVTDSKRSWETSIDERGRFEFVELPPGLYRLWLVSREDETRAFGTPTFEI